MVTVTPEHGSTHGDTLTWLGGVGGVDIPGLSMTGHSYSGIHGGGGEDSGYIPGLSIDGHSYSGIRGYSDMGEG